MLSRLPDVNRPIVLDVQGVVAPVVDMTILDMDADTMATAWSGVLYNQGMEEYNKNGDLSEAFDLDLRDPAVDGLQAYAAGYMQLGHWAMTWDRYFQFRGVIHAIELHSATLPDQHVNDVVGSLRTWMDPSVPAIPACEVCVAGSADHDTDPATVCELCPEGRFSDFVEVTSCASTCPVGATLPVAGSTTSDDCVLCPVGSFGEISDGIAICSPCLPGSSSDSLGVDGADACIACLAGKFSGLGWQHCEPAGCLDQWADNYDALAVVDSGECSYSCPNLWDKISGGTSPGGCLIFAEEVWQRRAANGSTIDGPVPPGSIADDQSTTAREVIAETWIVQGRHLAGATADSPDYVEFAANGGAIIAKATDDDSSRLVLRYVSVREHSATDWLATNEDRARMDLDHAAVERNDMTGGVEVLGPKGGFSFSYLTCSDNQGYCSGCFTAWMGDNSELSEARLSHSRILRNVAGLNTYGAVTVYPYVTLDVGFTEFVGNRAIRGGAIFCKPSAVLRIQHSVFAENIGDIVGGAIAAELSTIEIISTEFIANHASGLGATLHILQPNHIKILDTTFNPYVEGALVVFIGGRLAGCDEHPCDPGHSCSYAKYSLTCTLCPELQMSTDGLQCSHCSAGEQTNMNQTGCAPCVGNTFSTSGQCMPCIGTAVDEHRQCQECPLNQVADPPEDGCRCENGYYNASSGPLLCFGRDEPFDGALTQASKPTDPNLFCQECPSDCVDCTYTGYSGKPILNQGFATPTASAAEWFEQIPRVVFECPVDRDACLAEAPPVHNSSVIVQSSEKVCKAGYRGILCTMCTDGYSLGDVGCNECEKLTPASAVVLVVLLSVVIGGITHLSRSLKKIGGSKRLRLIIALIPELIGDFKVFIGLYQVLCSMGPTLEITCECDNVHKGVLSA